MKTYDVHCAYLFVQRIEAESAQEAKAIAERSAIDDGKQLAGPNVVAVLEVTDASL